MTIWLPSSQSLGLVTLHCSLALNKGDKTNTDEPLNEHPILVRDWEILGTVLFSWNNNDYLIIVITQSFRILENYQQLPVQWLQNKQNNYFLNLVSVSLSCDIR